MVWRRGAGVAGYLREGLLEAALDVGEGDDKEGALVPAGEEDFLFVAGVQEGQALVHVPEVHHGLAFRIHLRRYSYVSVVQVPVFLFFFPECASEARERGMAYERWVEETDNVQQTVTKLPLANRDGRTVNNQRCGTSRAKTSAKMTPITATLNGEGESHNNHNNTAITTKKNEATIATVPWITTFPIKHQTQNNLTTRWTDGPTQNYNSMI